MTARKRRTAATPEGRASLAALRRRAEAVLEVRPAMPSPWGESRTHLEHELRVHEVELRMQNEELSRLHRELEKARDWYRELYDAAPVGYVTTSRTGTIVAANRVSATILGVSTERLVGERFDAFVTPGSQASWKQHCQMVRDGVEGHACEVSLEKDGGQTVDVHLESAKQSRPTGATGGQIKTVMIDVTGPRRMERQVLEAQRDLAHVLRVRTLGELAPTLAHEISQPLQAIQGFAGACLLELKGRAGRPDPILKIVERIVEEVERASEIVSQVRRFVRKGTPNLAETDLNVLIREVVHFVAGLAKERKTRIQLELCRGMPAFPLDVVAIQQVLLNLALNGLDAMVEVPAPSRVLKIRSTLEARATALVAVSDAGPGLGSRGAQPDHLFESFYTTKAGGLGLGLSISRRIAEQHGGQLIAKSVAGPGATFVLSLPIAKTSGIP